MTKIINIKNLILACFTSIASISILAVIIYFYADYERNVVLNTNIDDYTIVFLILMFILFSFISFFLFKSYFKSTKSAKNTK